MVLYRLSITVLNSRVRGRDNLTPSLPQRIVNQIAPWSVIDEHDLLFISVLFYFHTEITIAVVSLLIILQRCVPVQLMHAASAAQRSKK